MRETGASHRRTTARLLLTHTLLSTGLIRRHSPFSFFFVFPFTSGFLSRLGPGGRAKASTSRHAVQMSGLVPSRLCNASTHDDGRLLDNGFGVCR